MNKRSNEEINLLRDLESFYDCSICKNFNDAKKGACKVKRCPTCNLNLSLISRRYKNGWKS